MQISQNGLDLIKQFEGYHRKLPDGRCTTYLCPAGVPTIGWGATSGIRMGMVMTPEEANEAFRKEMVHHEAAVNRYVTREMTQNQFDALVSFSYNCGIAALQRSSVLRHFNAGREIEAAKAFHLWNKARVNGKLTVLRGLVRRRAMEAALFQQPDPEPETAPEPEPEMPQEVIPSPEKPSRPTVAVTSATAAGGAGIVGSLSFAKEISGATSGIASDIKAIAPPVMSWAWPSMIIAIALVLVAIVFKR